MTLTWDGSSEAVVVEALEVADEDEDDDEDDDEDAGRRRRGRAGPAAGPALGAGGPRLHRPRHRGPAAGRPPCPLCGAAAEPRRPHLPAQERLHALTWTTARARRRARPDRRARSRRRPRPALQRRARDRRPAGRGVEPQPLLPGHAALPGPRARPRRGLRLQADPRRAAARRLPRWHPGESRGRGLSRVGGDRLEHRPAHGAARRTGRAGHGAALDRRRRVGRGHRPHPRRRPGAAADGGLRCHRQQRRPQGRPHAPGRQAATSTAWTTASASRPTPSCGRSSGAGAGPRLRREELDVLRSLAAALAAPLGDELRELLAPEEVAATARRVHACLARGASSRNRIPIAPRSPGRRSERIERRRRSSQPAMARCAASLAGAGEEEAELQVARHGVDRVAVQPHEGVRILARGRSPRSRSSTVDRGRSGRTSRSGGQGPCRVEARQGRQLAADAVRPDVDGESCQTAWNGVMVSGGATTARSSSTSTRRPALGALRGPPNGVSVASSSTSVRSAAEQVEQPPVGDDRPGQQSF